MKKSVVRTLSFVAICAGFFTNAHGQTTGSQTFTVSVPQNISITAPAAVGLTHDQSDNPQAFPAQAWTVRGNSLGGVNVSFATSNAFTHATDPTFKRDAKLNLALGTVQGPALWTIAVPQDQTNYLTGDGVAQVTASSNGVGRASFNLAVTFITEEFGTFAQGDYTTTVVGTVAAN